MLGPYLAFHPATVLMAHHKVFLRMLASDFLLPRADFHSFRGVPSILVHLPIRHILLQPVQHHTLVPRQ